MDASTVLQGLTLLGVVVLVLQSRKIMAENDDIQAREDAILEKFNDATSSIGDGIKNLVGQIRANSAQPQFLDALDNIGDLLKKDVQTLTDAGALNSVVGNPVVSTPVATSTASTVPGAHDNDTTPTGATPPAEDKPSADTAPIGGVAHGTDEPPTPSDANVPTGSFAASE